MKGSYNEDTIKVKVIVDYDRQRSVKYQKLCQQDVRPLDEACQRCTKMKFLVTDGVLASICHETCDIYKETQKTIDLIKKQFDYE